MKLIIFLLIILCEFQVCTAWSYTKFAKVNVFGYTLPEYLITFCRDFNIDVGLAYRWGLAESSHRDYVISSKLAYGRYQITAGWLTEYKRISGRTVVTPAKQFLLNDTNNCYLWCWTINFWRGRGYEDREIANIYLFGEYGFVYGKRFSDKYVKAIFD